jgi:hypothetical protein
MKQLLGPLAERLGAWLQTTRAGFDSRVGLYAAVGQQVAHLPSKETQTGFKSPQPLQREGLSVQSDRI